MRRLKVLCKVITVETQIFTVYFYKSNELNEPTLKERENTSPRSEYVKGLSA